MTSKSTDLVALFDLDGTLANYAEAMYRDLQSVKSPNENLYEIYNHNLPEWYKARMKMIRDIPGWWEKLNKIDLGFQLLEAATEIGFVIHVLTKGPSSATAAWSEKLRWCQKNLSDDVCVTVTQDKGLVYGRVLVDDYPEYQMQWLKHRPRGLAVVPVDKQNRHFNQDTARRSAELQGWNHEPHVICYDGSNLTEVLDGMQAAYERAPKEPLVPAVLV